MAIANVQVSGATSSSTVASLGVTISVTAGNLIALTVGQYLGVNGQHSVADTENTYTLAVEKTLASHQYSAIWYAYAGTTASRTITLTNTSGNRYTALGVGEFSGVDSGVSPSTNSNDDGGAAGTAITMGSVTSTEDGSLYVATEAYEGSSTTQTPDGGFTLIYSYSGDVSTPIYSMYQVQGTAGALNPGVTLGASRRWAACVAVFQPTGGGGGGLSIPIAMHHYKQMMGAN